MALNLYEELFCFPTPTSEENEVLIAKAVAGGMEEKWDLLLHNIRLIPLVAKEYTSSRFEEEDALVDGIMGLYKAICRLKTCSAKQFVIFAGAYIRQSISRNTRLRKSRFNSFSQKTTGFPVSLDLKPNGDDEKEFQLLDIENSSPKEMCELRDAGDFSKKLLELLYRSKTVNLTSYHKDILNLLLSNGCNVQDASEKTGTTRSNIYQVLCVIRRRSLRYLDKKLGKELEDIYGTRGRSHNFRFYDRDGRVSSGFKYFTKEVDAITDCAKQLEKKHPSLYKKHNWYNRCNKNKRDKDDFDGKDDKGKLVEKIASVLRIESEKALKSSSLKIQELERKLNDFKKT